MLYISVTVFIVVSSPSGDEALTSAETASPSGPFSSMFDLSCMRVLYCIMCVTRQKCLGKAVMVCMHMGLSYEILNCSLIYFSKE